MKTQSSKYACAIGATSLLSLLSAVAGTYHLSWFTLDSGGGTSSGGAYAVSGTIGQPDAGQLAGGDYTLSGGFWGVGAASPPQPELSLTVSRAGTSLVVKWPFPSTGFVLQQTSALAAPPSAILWTDAIFPAAIPVGSDWTVTIPSPSGNRYFRLRRP